MRPDLPIDRLVTGVCLVVAAATAGTIDALDSLAAWTAPGGAPAASGALLALGALTGLLGLAVLASCVPAMRRAWPVTTGITAACLAACAWSLLTATTYQHVQPGLGVRLVPAVVLLLCSVVLARQALDLAER